VCYRLVFASDRRLPTRRISDHVQVVPSDSTPDVEQHFPTGSHFADIITVQCACDLVFDPHQRGPRAIERQRRVRADYAAIADWAEEQLVQRHRPLWMYLCSWSDFELPQVGTIAWSVDELRAPDAHLPERTLIEFVTVEA